MWSIILVAIVFIALVVWATKNHRTEDSSGPIVHLDQECPYKIEK